MLRAVMNRPPGKSARAKSGKSPSNRLRIIGGRWRSVPITFPAIEAVRWRQQRNLMTTLLLSVGVPKICGGDELGRTQKGNNNAYCQDNEISWFNWDAVDESLLPFARRVMAIRAEHPVFRRRRWFKGRPVRGAGVTDIGWFRPDGVEMTDDDWQQDHARSFAVFLNGDALRDVDDEGDPVRDESVLLLFNAHDDVVPFTMPAAQFGVTWHAILDTSSATGAGGDSVAAAQTLNVPGRTVVVLTRAAGE